MITIKYLQFVEGSWLFIILKVISTTYNDMYMNKQYSAKTKSD